MVKMMKVLMLTGIASITLTACGHMEGNQIVSTDERIESGDILEETESITHIETMTQTEKSEESSEKILEESDMKENLESLTEGTEATEVSSVGLAETESEIESFMTEASELTESIFQTDVVRLQPSSIQRVNEVTMGNVGSGVRDICAFTSLSAKQLRSDVESYQVPNVTYCNGAEMTEADRAYLMSLCNLEGIAQSGDVSLQYGIVTDNAAVRSFPSEAALKNGLSDRDFDYLQESMLLLGEGVAVAHVSLDGAYYFVYSYNYYGWVKADCIGLCNYEEMCEYLNAEQFMMLTDNKIIEEVQDYVRIGTKIPYETHKNGTYVLRWPTSQERRLNIERVSVAEDADCFYDGYVPYNSANTMVLYQRLLGETYGWGDTNENMDCSSTVNSVYRCFGFWLPRNTSAFNQIGATVTDISGWEVQQKLEKIRQCDVGTLLVMRGHVMTYVGTNENESYIIHNVTYYYQNGEQVMAYQCALTPLSIETSSQESYLSKILYVIEIP